jgi:GUN4-like
VRKNKRNFITNLSDFIARFRNDPSFTIAMIGLVIAIIGLIASLLAVAYPVGFRSFLTNLIPGEKYNSDLIPDKASNVGIDYNHLNNLLREGKYKEANTETNLIIFEKILEKKSGDLTREDMEKISEKRFENKDILTINKIWNIHTDNNYGFNIQNCIFLQTYDIDDDSWEDKFLKEIGWKREEGSIEPDKMEFSKDGKKGYLPRLFYTSNVQDDMKILSDFLHAKENKCPNTSKN